MLLRPRYAATALALCAVACTKQDQSSQTADTSSAKAAPSTTAAAPTGSANTVTVTAKDFAFDAPASVPAGWTTIHLVNHGQQIHHVQVLKFDQGKSLADLQAGMKQMKPTDPLPPWVHEVGGPNAPAPGGEFSATINLDPGNYAFVCFVDTPDHVPHVMKGMAHPFTVAAGGTTSTAAEPTADVTVTLSDYKFDFSKPLTAGTHTIRVENSAMQGHELEIVQLDSGKTVDDVLKWAEKYQGPPPGRPIGGMTGLEHGAHGYFTVDLAPGNYGLICFYPDMKDGKPHFMHGMKQQIKIS